MTSFNEVLVLIPWTLPPSGEEMRTSTGGRDTKDRKTIIINVLSIYPSIHRSIYSSICLYICLSIYLSVYLSIYLSFYPSIYSVSCVIHNIKFIQFYELTICKKYYSIRRVSFTSRVICCNLQMKINTYISLINLHTLYIHIVCTCTYMYITTHTDTHTHTHTHTHTSYIHVHTVTEYSLSGRSG